jgi:hypothetical protein
VAFSTFLGFVAFGTGLDNTQNDKSRAAFIDETKPVSRSENK